MFCTVGDVTIDPPSISIPLDQEPVSRWPDFESDVKVGHATFEITYKVTAKRIQVGGGVEFALAVPTFDAVAPNLTQTSGWLLGPSDNFPNFPVGAFQTSHPTEANYTTARASRAGV